MYLKEIRTSGFKSFADKINLNLDNEITCIVGPNGSGKSNIVDAVKWVLGEQSVKNLRGSNNMADVIFSGSKTRNSLNVASVTLVFDNTDSYLKIPYSEISVTRKVYRNGENEYFINNEKCRLKDINDLFLDSGIGKYAFNIISQGEVANIINSSPYERRGIFEEAAGVLKYKKRKEEALRKLEKSNENMVRIKDIIMELDTQIEPLRKQREEALAYLDYKKKLSDIEIALIVSDLESLNAEFKDTTDKIASLENEIASLMSNSSTSDVKLENYKKDLMSINNDIRVLNNEYVEYTRELEKLNGEKNILKERSKYDSNDVKIHDNISNLKERTLSLKNDINSINEEIRLIDFKTNGVSSDIDRINNEYGLKSKVINDIENEINNKNKKVTELSYKIKSLTDYIEQGAGVSINVKRVLTNPVLSGIHNTISNLIDVDEEYLMALTVALGGAKDYIVVDTTIDAKKAIEFLKSNNLGRVTFFPLNVIKPRFIDKDVQVILNSMPGYINTLDKVVTYDEKYDNIVKNQLGNVILVDNLDNANKIRDMINNKYRIVTLTGEVINVGGSITGGKVKTSSVINERHELLKLSNDKDKIISEINDLKIKLSDELNNSKDYQGMTFDKEKERVLLEEERKAKELRLQIVNNEYEKYVSELSSLESVVNESLSDEESKIMEKYYETMSLKDKVSNEIKQKNSSKEKLESIIDELEASYRISSSKLRNLEAELKKNELANSRSSIKMDNLLNTLSENYEMTFEKARANYILEIDKDIAREEVNSYKRKLASIGPVNTLAIDEYDRVNTRYEFLTKQNSDLEAAIEELLKIISELDEVMKAEFLRLFKQVQVEFDKVFKELFGGGEAKLELTDSNNLLETGINIIVTPPGKKLSSINLLSGGEKTLTAISLLFAILNLKDIPFCLFDEVEAALDEANVDKFGSYLSKYKGKTQLIIITHKKKTMEYANTLYGITMQESGVSKLVSVKLVN